MDHLNSRRAKYEPIKSGLGVLLTESCVINLRLDSLFEKLSLALSLLCSGVLNSHQVVGLQLFGFFLYMPLG